MLKWILAALIFSGASAGLMEGCSLESPNSFPKKCIMCQSGYWLTSDRLGCMIEGSYCEKEDRGKCYQCAAGFFVDGEGQCRKCGEGCAVCERGDHCLLCFADYDWMRGKCLKTPTACTSQCLNNMFSDYNIGCFDRCLPGAYRVDFPLNLPPQIVCAPGFLNKAGGCERCQASNCITCMASDSGDSNKCITCEAGYYRVNGVCVKCNNSTCLECASKTSCNSCPSDMYKSGNECLNCKVAHCSNCASSGETCYSCLPGFYEDKPYNATDRSNVKHCFPYESGNCAKGNSISKACEVCMDGYYMREDFKCVSCSPNCRRCNGYEACLQCIYPFVVSNGSCVPNRIEGCSLSIYLSNDVGMRKPTCDTCYPGYNQALTEERLLVCEILPDGCYSSSIGVRSCKKCYYGYDLTLEGKCRPSINIDTPQSTTPNHTTPNHTTSNDSKYNDSKYNDTTPNDTTDSKYNDSMNMSLSEKQQAITTESGSSLISIISVSLNIILIGIILHMIIRNRRNNAMRVSENNVIDNRIETVSNNVTADDSIDAL